jgi:hypothetical protein
VQKNRSTPEQFYQPNFSHQLTGTQNQIVRFEVLALMMEAARTSETLVNFYQTTRCYNPEDSNLQNQILQTRGLFYICSTTDQFASGEQKMTSVVN